MNMKSFAVKNLDTKRSLLAGVLSLGLAITPAAVWGQPEMDDAPGAGDPPQRQDGGRGGRGMRGPNAEQMQQRREEGLRRMLTQAGFTDEATQNAVVAFAGAQDKERFASQDKVRRLAQAVQNKLSDAEIATLLAEVRADVAAANARREAAVSALDAQLGLSRNPRLDAVLALAGLTEPGIGGRGGPGGFGGPGGREGGRGGFGGRGPGGPEGRGPEGRGPGGPEHGGERPPMPDA